MKKWGETRRTNHFEKWTINIILGANIPLGAQTTYQYKTWKIDSVQSSCTFVGLHMYPLHLVLGRETNAPFNHKVAFTYMIR